MSRVACVATLGVLLGSATASAQICAGIVPFAGRPIQLFGSGLFSDNARSFGGGVAFGSAGAFGQLELGTTHFDDFDASSVNFGGGAGYQVPLDKKGAAQLCPAAGVGFVSGPKDIGGSGIDYSETDVSIGIGVGIVATRTQQVQVVPTASIAFASANGKLKDASGSSISDSESFGIVGLGVGFVFNQQVSVKPSVFIPFAVDGASTSFGVTLAVNFGATR